MFGPPYLSIAGTLKIFLPANTGAIHAKVSNCVAQNVGIDAGIAKPAIGPSLKMMIQELPDDIARILKGAFPHADSVIAQADEAGGEAAN